ncbi:MAG: DoxX family protein [Marinilabiliales bacterium]|nr:DoxX family protein [Marinilabiliales bacterium]
MRTKTWKVIFWSSTILIFLMEGLMPALTSQSELAKEGIRHLGYPAYFGNWLVVFKVAGALTLILPFLHATLKEWAYAGFTFDFLFAAISHTSVDGWGFQTVMPVIALGILAASYFSYHKLKQ